MALVSVISADVEGYSRLMGSDEFGNLRDLTQRRTTLDGLIALIEQRIADKSFAYNIYILVDASFAPLAGNLKAWPSTVTAGSGHSSTRH